MGAEDRLKVDIRPARPLSARSTPLRDRQAPSLRIRIPLQTLTSSALALPLQDSVILWFLGTRLGLELAPTTAAISPALHDAELRTSTISSAQLPLEGHRCDAVTIVVPDIRHIAHSSSSSIIPVVQCNIRVSPLISDRAPH